MHMMSVMTSTGRIPMAADAHAVHDFKTSKLPSLEGAPSLRQHLLSIVRSFGVFQVGSASRLKTMVHIQTRC